MVHLLSVGVFVGGGEIEVMPVALSRKLSPNLHGSITWDRPEKGRGERFAGLPRAIFS